ncbi:MAG: type I methionyl aminopeptidase [bacterium]|nr:type I methionyl aminopeptidase [bacterium]
MIHIRSSKELAKMRRGGRLVAETLQILAKLVKPGVSTRELDKAAYKFITSRGAKPSFLGYRGFPASICTSVNCQVVHGIPGRYRLEEGDIIGIDLGVKWDGYHTDAAITVPVGKIDPETLKLVEVTLEALKAAIAEARPGKRVEDISFAIQSTAEAEGFSATKNFVGHGIGKKVHEEPQIPNLGTPGKGPRLKPGMVLCPEPMINVGTGETDLLEDGWTAVTKDRSLSAHFEHTIVVTDGEPEIITAFDGGWYYNLINNY